MEAAQGRLGLKVEEDAASLGDRDAVREEVGLPGFSGKSDDLWPQHSEVLTVPCNDGVFFELVFENPQLGVLVGAKARVAVHMIWREV